MSLFIIAQIYFVCHDKIQFWQGTEREDFCIILFGNYLRDGEREKERRMNEGTRRKRH